MILDAFNADELRFRCNICKTMNINRIGLFHREIRDCSGCGSTPRFRGIVDLVSRHVFNSSIDLPDFPKRIDVRGLGMSEWNTYADVFAERFNFVNTFQREDPQLDIMNNDDVARYAEFDFIICSEIFEHVAGPVLRGLKNLRRMLSPTGVLIFSVPFTDGDTVEHFGRSKEVQAYEINDAWVVVSRDEAGMLRVTDRRVCFHGGPGDVLEMRLFGHDDLIRNLRRAGFHPTVHSTPLPEIGYLWRRMEDRPGYGFNLSYLLSATVAPTLHEG